MGLEEDERKIKYKGGKKLENVRKQAMTLLVQAMDTMTESYPEDVKAQLYREDFQNSMNELLNVQRMGSTPVMGLFDVDLNEYVTIDLLALVALLAGELNRILEQNPTYTVLSTGISIGIFMVSFLNIIEPSIPVELEQLDARVYCEILFLHKTVQLMQL